MRLTDQRSMLCNKAYLSRASGPLACFFCSLFIFSCTCVMLDSPSTQLHAVTTLSQTAQPVWHALSSHAACWHIHSEGCCGG